MTQDERQTIEKAINIFFKAWYTEPTQAEQEYYKKYFGEDHEKYKEFYNKALSPRLKVYRTRYDYTDYNEPEVFRIPEDIEKLKTAINNKE